MSESTTLKDLLLEALREKAAREFALMHARGILMCMKEEGVNLETAIASCRAVLIRESELFPRDEDHEGFMEFEEACLARAEEVARQGVEQARELVDLADNGKTTMPDVNDDTIRAEHEKNETLVHDSSLPQEFQDRLPGLYF